MVITPGVIIPVNDKDNYRVMNEYTGPDASSFNMLQTALKFAGENSGQVMGGGPAQTSRGGKVTARQAMMQEEQSRQLLGLNAKMLEKLERDCTELRCKNILQFYTLPDKVEAITGAKPDEYQTLFSRVFRVDDTKLSDGTYGTTVLRMADENKMPTEHELEVEEEVAALQGQNVEIFAFTPDYIRNIDFDVQTVSESTYMQSKSLKQALGGEFYQLMLANPLANQEENLRELVDLYDKDPDKFIKQMSPNPEMGGLPGQPGMPQQQPMPPGGQQQPQTMAQVGGGGKPSLDSLMDG
jgi:hypothetical protein